MVDIAAPETVSDPVPQLADHARADGCEFGHALANHLPMLLVILPRLGAPPRRVEQFARRYRDASQLRAPPPRVARITRADWTRHLGERERESDYRAFFAGELAVMGVAGVQRAYLPQLTPGIAASALHALMRLAYANLAGSPQEVAVALGYWAATYLELPAGGGQALELPAGAGQALESPAGGGQGDTADPAAILDRLRARLGLLRIEPETDLLWHAMRAVGRDAGFAAELDRFRTDDQSLRRCAAAALALFAGAFDFCSLHALTGTHWIRLLPVDVADRPAMLRRFWRAIAAVYPKMGMPPLPEAEALAAMRELACPDWAELEAAAVASDDEHDASLVFSAREEEAAWGDPLYRRVAARRVGLIGW